MCAFALPVAPAFGEGSVDFNLGPGTADRHGLSVSNPDGSGPRSPLSVYAQAGETIQMASSLMGVGGNIRVFAPGADPLSATPLLDCALTQPLSGRIASRAQELAGPLPNPGGYDACDFTVPADGIYSVIMYGAANANGGSGTVDAPNTAATQGYNAAMWDVTVRNAGGAAQPGRLFAPSFQFRTTCSVNTDPASNVQAYVYTKTGYEYQVNFYDHRGCNWVLTSDDKGIVDSVTKDRIFASFSYHSGATGAELAATLGGGLQRLTTQWPLFANAIDPLVISGPGGVAETFGYSATPIAPSSNPLANAAFTGSGGQAGATNRGSGGTISFTSPSQMAGLGYALEIDIDRNGVFGDDSDVVDATGELSANGSNSVAWNGRDAAGNVPACGDYPYRVRSTLAEVHFTQNDVENSGGTRIERLSLPGDATLGNVLAASYDNRDPYKGGLVITNGTPSFATSQPSGPGFNSWTSATGDGDYVDTWARLPEVQATGTLRLLCADVQVVKGGTAERMVPGENYTYTVEVKNNGPDTATNVVATDQLPSELSFVSASAGCAEANGLVTCTASSLAPGASHTFEITVDVPSSLDKCVPNTARVTNDIPDLNLGNNESTSCPPPHPRADLSITKVASAAQVGTGGQVMYTLVVNNAGPSDARGVTVTDPMASGLSLVSADPSQGTCSTTGGQVSCDLGGLKDGGSAQVLVTATVTAAAGASCEATTITNTGTVSSDNVDPDASNNTDSAQICVPPNPPPPATFDLEVEKRTSVRRPYVGQRVTYRVVVTNNGPSAAPEVTLTDTLNAPVKVVSVRSTQGSCERRIPMRCELGTIAAGDSVTIRIRVKHREATGCSPRQRQAASATGNGTDTNPANNIDTVDVCVRKVPVKLTKVANRAVVRGGETFSYRIRVRNPTKGEARNVKVCDRLPSGLRYLSSQPKAKGSGRQQCWTINRLKAGKSKTYRITVRAANGASGRKTNTATATSPDIKGRRLRARDRVRIEPLADRLTG